VLILLGGCSPCGNLGRYWDLGHGRRTNVDAGSAVVMDKAEGLAGVDGDAGASDLSPRCLTADDVSAIAVVFLCLSVLPEGDGSGDRARVASFDGCARGKCDQAKPGKEDWSNLHRGCWVLYGLEELYIWSWLARIWWVV
jgi:hypothetical protein